MSPQEFATFFAVLALACGAGAVLLAGAGIVRRRRPAHPIAAVVDDLSGGLLWVACLVAAVTTAGSLYFSEVANYVPCELCWYQRICVYPLTTVLLVAAVRRDRRIALAGVPQAVVGAGISIYHTQLQAFPDQRTFCSAVNPCTVRYVWEFGFVSLPLMALCAFTFILVAIALTPGASPDSAPEGG